MVETIGSDGGALLLRRVDERLGLCRRVAAVLADPRDRSRIRHTQQDMVRQRVFGLALGNEDLNDHGALRTDTLLQTAV
ncbi:MAG: transposase [Betaproteobacteria bacterium]